MENTIYSHRTSVLGYSSIMTSLQPLGEKTVTWDGTSGASYTPWAPGEQPSQNGDCASFNKLGISSIPCNEPSNFMCEAKHLETTAAQTTEEKLHNEISVEYLLKNFNLEQQKPRLLWQQQNQQLQKLQQLMQKLRRH